MQGCHKTAKTPLQLWETPSNVISSIVIILCIWPTPSANWACFFLFSLSNFFVVKIRDMPVIELQTVSVVLSIILLLFQHVKCAWNFQSAIIIQPTNTLDFYLAKYIWKIICRHICGPSGKIFSFTSKKWPNWKEKGDNWIGPFRNVNFYTSRMCRTVQGLLVQL